MLASLQLSSHGHKNLMILCSVFQMLAPSECYRQSIRDQTKHPRTAAEKRDSYLFTAIFTSRI